MNLASSYTKWPNAGAISTPVGRGFYPPLHLQLAMAASMVSPTSVAVASTAKLAAVGICLRPPVRTTSSAAMPRRRDTATTTCPAAAAPPVTDEGIYSLADTLENRRESMRFRAFLRHLDKTWGATADVKGRFERGLDFIFTLRPLYYPTFPTVEERRQKVESVQTRFFTSMARERASCASQLSLTRLEIHVAEVKVSPEVEPNLEIIRPVYEAVYRKLQSKHNKWKEGMRTKNQPS